MLGVDISAVNIELLYFCPQQNEILAEIQRREEERREERRRKEMAKLVRTCSSGEENSEAKPVAV